jgi:hypothetical protein
MIKLEELRGIVIAEVFGLVPAPAKALKECD